MRRCSASWRWCGVILRGRPNRTPRSLARLRPSPVLARISSRSQTQARKVARELLKRADTIVKHAQTVTTPLELARVCKAWTRVPAGIANARARSVAAPIANRELQKSTGGGRKCSQLFPVEHEGGDFAQGPPDRPAIAARLCAFGVTACKGISFAPAPIAPARSETPLPDGFYGIDGDLEFLRDALPPSCRRDWNGNSKPGQVGNISTPTSGREHAVVKRDVRIDGARKDHARPQ